MIEVQNIHVTAPFAATSVVLLSENSARRIRRSMRRARAGRMFEVADYRVWRL
jgi:hypothetical protein